MNDSNTVREVSQCFNLPFSKMLPSHITTGWMSCKEPWRGQQSCLIRDCNHLKWDFILNVKKNRKGQNFWTNAHAFVHLAPTKRKCFTSWLCFALVDFFIKGDPDWMTQLWWELWVRWVGDGAVTRHRVPRERTPRVASWCWQHRATATHTVLHYLRLFARFFRYCGSV